MTLELLKKMTSYAGTRQTEGLEDVVVERFLKIDPTLGKAIEQAEKNHSAYQKTEFDRFLKMDEGEACLALQQDLVNFYPENQQNPYISIAAKGPWIITSHGAVIHDSGGYGMLGLGHSPDHVVEQLGKDYVIANVMTPNISHFKFTEKLKSQIGINSKVSPLFSKFICMNSGSESVTVAARISDVNAKSLTDSGGRHHGKKIKMLALEGGFHGRTDRPAKASPSSFKKYQHLASFRDYQDTMIVAVNDCNALRKVFEEADASNTFIELFLMEPVMGEGNPGRSICPKYYKLARELTKERGTLLLVDSIQAGLRAQGCLSICDYPRFEDAPPPDMETFSKAINAGQYPLSILAMNESTASLYVKGVYGNTMTANPRALEIACAVLDEITPEVRQNIVERGREFVEKMNLLKEKYPDVVLDVKGTGLLCAMELDPTRFPVVGFDEVEEKLRKAGIGVIHGGQNALRFTPHFNITSTEIDMIMEKIDWVISLGPKG